MKGHASGLRCLRRTRPYIDENRDFAWARTHSVPVARMPRRRGEFSAGPNGSAVSLQFWADLPTLQVHSRTG